MELKYQRENGSIDWAVVLWKKILSSFLNSLSVSSLLPSSIRYTKFQFSFQSHFIYKQHHSSPNSPPSSNCTSHTMAGANKHPPTSSSTSRLLLLLTILPLTLAAFAFLLQWRGGVTDPVTRWSPDQNLFPGMSTSDHIQQRSQPRSRSDCSSLFGNSHSPSFPYFRDWTLDFSSDLSPKVRFIVVFFITLGSIFDFYILKPLSDLIFD